MAKRYLGRTTELTLARLEEIAAFLIWTRKSRQWRETMIEAKRK
jgi:hypothetical protein